MTPDAPVSPGHVAGLNRRFCKRLRAAIPTTREVLSGAPVWGTLMALSALIALLLREGGATFQLTKILVLFFSGGTLAWPFAVFFGRFCALDRPVETRFAAYFLCFTMLTIASTAFLFAMHYRLFYERWHAPFGTLIWTYQFVFTSAGAVYQFIVMGLRLYLPFGFAALAATSLWLATRPDDKRR